MDWRPGSEEMRDYRARETIAELRRALADRDVTIAALRGQVERYEAMVEAARALAASTNSERHSIDAAVVVLRRLNDLREALAALDTASP